jgi:hypothetical protein
MLNQLENASGTFLEALVYSSLLISVAISIFYAAVQPVIM